ncbi:hypothetical protein [Mycoplasma leachii]|uniref:hypothetical protein n=1 Tax=Mycoplasma leachii TaxID=2105 RepID=UPI003DA541CC
MKKKITEKNKEIDKVNEDIRLVKREKNSIEANKAIRNRTIRSLEKDVKSVKDKYKQIWEDFYNKNRDTILSYDKEEYEIGNEYFETLRKYWLSIWNNSKN